jgi:hypothetical protein
MSLLATGLRTELAAPFAAKAAIFLRELGELVFFVHPD